MTGNTLNNGKRSISYRLVAAVDTLPNERNAADYKCLGSDDGVIINAALAEVPSTGGIVLLAPGTYTLGSTGITLPATCTLEGAGQASIITGSATNLVTMGRLSVLSNIKLSAGSGNHVKIPEAARLATVLECWSFNPTNAHIVTEYALGNIYSRGDRARIDNFYYERPEHEVSPDYDIVPSGIGNFSSSGIAHLEEEVRRLLDWKNKIELVLALSGIEA